mgnify:FL=1|jgi:uncharacterized membrane protein YhaH (DUF805 family)
MENYQQQGAQYQQPYQQAYDQQGQQPYTTVPEAPAMGFADAVKSCFSNYATFTGRATRAEFWWWKLFSAIVSIVTMFIPFVGWLVSLAMLIPGLAVSWRRLHDMGKAGGWYFIALVPIVGWIFAIIWYCTKSEPFDNRFGPYLG